MLVPRTDLAASTSGDGTRHVMYFTSLLCGREKEEYIQKVYMSQAMRQLVVGFVAIFEPYSCAPGTGSFPSPRPGTVLVMHGSQCSTKSYLQEVVSEHKSHADKQ